MKNHRKKKRSCLVLFDVTKTAERHFCLMLHHLNLNRYVSSCSYSRLLLASFSPPLETLFYSILNSPSPPCPRPTPASLSLMSVFVDALGWGAIVQNDHNYDGPPPSFALILPKNKLCKAERGERSRWVILHLSLASLLSFFFYFDSVELLSWFLCKYFSSLAG